MKKLLYVTLFVTFLISVFTFTTTAATYGDLTYTVSNGEVTITDCSTSVTSVTIPSEIDGYPVTSIGSYAFYNCTSLASITISTSVTSIGYDAFENCTSLEEVHITSIDSWLSIDFVNDYSNPLYYADNGLYIDGFPITSITIPNHITDIEPYAFSNCSSLVKVNISGESELTYIGERAFSGCSSLSQISFPSKLEAIGWRAFDGCSSMQKINIYDIETWCSIADYDTFYDFGYYSLYLNHELLENVVIPDGVTTINEGTFYYCNSIKTVKLPASLTNIGGTAFMGCSNLNKVYIDDIASWCNVEIADMPWGKGESGTSPLENADLYVKGELVVDLVIPDGVTTIKKSLFSGCESIKSVVFPQTLKSIQAYAFAYCDHIKEITIPATTAFIASTAFTKSYYTNTAIYGFVGTYAEEFAELKGFIFVPLDDVTYDITFDLNGGNGTFEKDLKGHDTDYTLPLVVPTKENATFAGWSTVKNGNVEYKSGESFSLNKDTTFYAVWHPTISISDRRCALGMTFTLPIEIKNNPGLTGLHLEVTYPEALTFVSAEAGEALTSLDFTISGDTSASPLTLMWDGVDADNTNGVIVNLTFKVSENAVEGDYDITVKTVTAADKENDSVTIPEKSAKLTIKSYVVGDADSDGEINLKDVITIRRFLVGGYDVEESPSFDTNSDGYIDLRDVINLRRYLVGGYGVEL